MCDFWDNYFGSQEDSASKLSLIEEIWADFRANGVDREMIESPRPGKPLDQHKIKANKHMITRNATYSAEPDQQIWNMEIGHFMVSLNLLHLAASFLCLIPDLLQYCVFCANNGSCEKWIYSHNIKDKNGRVTCPKLFSYRCPICGATREAAHTVKYCPKKRIITMEDTFHRNRK